MSRKTFAVILALSYFALAASNIYLIHVRSMQLQALAKAMSARDIDTRALANVGGIVENLENALLACLVDKLPPPGAWPPARTDL